MAQPCREILFYENYDLENLVTPVDVNRFNQLLIDSGCEEKLRSEVIDGCRNGFDLGYEGLQDVKLESPNLRFCVGDEIDLWNKVMKGVKLKRYVGLFEKPPL